MSSSPPIAVGAGTEQYTQDVAVININASKIDPSSFIGNVNDLGTKITPKTFIDKMCPNPGTAAISITRETAS